MFQRAGALDVQLKATKHTSLDKNNSLELSLSTGWNTLKTCEIRVKPTTGGLRLLTIEAKAVDSSVEFPKPTEAGVFNWTDLEAESTHTLRFPYSIEQDVGDVSATVEVSYTTEAGKFYFAKSMVIPISLALGVNVQDVFKHQALFSRFNVSTASSSPLRLFKSELLPSELFESSFGVAPQSTVMVFPKQSATLLFKVQRKTEGKIGKRSGKVMYLKLYYSVLQREIEDLIVSSLTEALETTPLKQYSRLMSGFVLKEAKNKLQTQDFERTALLGAVSTLFLADVSWDRYLTGIGNVFGTQDDAAESITAFLKDWQKSSSRIAIPTSDAEEASSILIPVEVPSLAFLHTADMRLQKPTATLIEGKAGATPTVCINQMIPATLHLKWTRVWDTEVNSKEDPEFSYEVTAPSDTWLLGGRRKGHFIIPTDSISSAPETEGEIPLVLIPLREGWLPYPTVEIRQILAEGGMELPQASEVDCRNLGETIRVVGERKAVTVSLDASGPGGGPLVLESEGLAREKGRIIA